MLKISLIIIKKVTMLITFFTFYAAAILIMLMALASGLGMLRGRTATARRGGTAGRAAAFPMGLSAFLAGFAGLLGIELVRSPFLMRRLSALTRYFALLGLVHRGKTALAAAITAAFC